MKDKKHILSILEQVKDPEIPVLSLVDLGVITNIEINDSKVLVEMTPTFAGCPAMDTMRENVLEVLRQHGFDDAEVKISFENPWNSNKITEKGREALRKFGLAPPPHHNIIFDIDILENITCPFCQSHNTELKSPFGPTLCRSLHYCHDCKQGFEQFKPL